MTDSAAPDPRVTLDVDGRRAAGHSTYATSALGLSEDDEVALGGLLRSAFEADHEPHLECGGELA